MNVLTSDRWGFTPERKTELEEHGVVFVSSNPLEAIGLPKIVYGEKTVGTVTHEEAMLFRSLWDIKNRVEGIDRNIQAEVMHKMAEKVQEARDASSVVTIPGHEITECLGPGERETYWKDRQTVGYLHALFHYTIGERLGMHHHQLGLREGGQIVDLGGR